MQVKYSIFLLLFLINNSLLLSQNDCNSCYKAIDIYKQKVTVLNSSLKSLIFQKDSLIQDSKSKVVLLNQLIKDSKSNEKLPAKSEINSKKETNLIINLKSKLKEYSDKANNISVELKKSKQDNYNQKVAINNLKSDLKIHNKSIIDLNSRISKSEILIDSLKTIVNCIIDFQTQKDEGAENAIKQIQQARNNYELFQNIKLKKETKQSDLDSLISKVINIYSQYKTYTRNKKCGGVELSYVADNLSAIDHFYISKIYAYNEGNAVNRLDSGNKINEATERLLSNLGMSLNKGFYDEQSLSNEIIRDFGNIMNSIGYFAISERRAGSDNSELIVSFQNILSAYEKKNYVEAISLYNKYSRYKSLSTISEKKDLLDEIDYCIGSILAWNLADLKKNKNLYIQGSWIDKIDGDINVYGENMIKTLLKKKNLNPALRKKCLIALSKLYASF